MGVLRGFGLVIVSVLLFVSLLATGIFATLNYSLTYENVQPKIYNIADNVIVEQIGANEIVNQLTPFLEIYCQNNTEVIQNFQGYTFVFPCEVIGQGQDSILNYSINYLVSDFYYKEYNCSFVKCFEESDVPLFLVSAHAKDYWKSLFRKFLIFDLILIGLIILFVEKKSNSPLLVGSLLIPTALIISQLQKIGTAIAKLVLSPISAILSKENSKEIISQIVDIFFSESVKVFLWMLIAGLILIAIGLFFKLTALGLKIKKKIEEKVLRKKVEELEKKVPGIKKEPVKQNPPKIKS